MKPSDRLFVCAFVASATYVAVLHFWRLGSVPAGFYIDESSIAYNAYSIAQTGADEYGTKHPLFFRCFENYQDPVMIYALAPLINALGLSEGVARFPSALFALLAALAFAFVVHEYGGNRWLGLASGTVFAVVPWAFSISRTNMAGYMPMLFGLALGIWLLLVALRRSSMAAAVAAGLAWAFAMYAHNIGRPIGALLLIAFAVSFHARLRTERSATFAFLATYVFALAPLLVSALGSSTSLTRRFGNIGIFADHPSLGEAIGRFFSRYVEYFSPRFLFLRGDANLRHHTGTGGELFLFLAPLILTGLYALTRAWRQRPDYRFVLLGLLVSPVAAALTMDRMHGTRALPAVLFWLLTAAIGAQLVSASHKHGGLFLLVLLLAGAIEIGRYYNDYFGAYQERSRDESLAPITEGLRFSFKQLAAGQTLYVSPSAGAPIGVVLDRNLKPLLYSHLAFYRKVDPQVYQREGLPSDAIRFYDGSITNPGLLLRCNVVLAGRNSANQIVLALNPEPLPPASQLLQTIPAGGPMNYEIYRVGE